MKVLRYVFSALAILASLFVGGKIWVKQHSAETQKHYEVIEQKPFVVIIPSYNNAAYIEKNLTSVFSQRYDNYRVIYIDDFSTDNTLKKAREFINLYNHKNRATIISNSSNCGALANIYNAIHSCVDHEIIVLLDGDDFLAHEEVLNTLNKAYADPNIWLTYGNYLDYPSYKQDPQISRELPTHIIKHSSYRDYAWVTSHLRSFYTSLFKEIKVEDLFHNGHYFPMAGDLSIVFPMLEMASTHTKFIEDVLYLYNRENPISDHKINFSFQQKCANIIRNKKNYAPLEKLPIHPENLQEKADVLVFSCDRPMQLYALLESTNRYIKGINTISVIYRANTQAFEEGYNHLKQTFHSVKFIKQKNAPDDFKDIFINTLFEAGITSSPYVVFLVDDIIIKDDVDLSLCIDALEKAKAYGFYLAHNTQLKFCFMAGRYQGLPPYHLLKGFQSKEPIYAWQFSSGKDDWAYSNIVDMVLYRKEDLKNDFEKIDFNNPTSLERSWNLRAKKKHIGLFYETSKCVNIPVNLIKTNLTQNRHLNAYSIDELQEKFESGLKINIDPLYKIANNSRHINYEITFTPRQ